MLLLSNYTVILVSKNLKKLLKRKKKKKIKDNLSQLLISWRRLRIVNQLYIGKKSRIEIIMEDFGVF
jgi:hypothetical protein